MRVKPQRRSGFRGLGPGEPLFFLGPAQEESGFGEGFSSHLGGCKPVLPQDARSNSSLKAVHRAASGRGKKRMRGLTREVVEVGNAALMGTPFSFVRGPRWSPWPASQSRTSPGITASAECSKRRTKPASRWGLLAATTDSRTNGPPARTHVPPRCSKEH